MRTKKARKEVEFMDKYRLTADPMNIILQEKQIVTGKGKRPLTKSKIGDVNWMNIAYFSTPKNALDYVIEKEIRELWIDDLKEVVKVTDKLYQAIQGIKLDLSPE